MAGFLIKRLERWVLLIAPPLLWSTMIVVGRYVIGDVSAVPLTFLTWLIAGLSLIPWSWRELRSNRHTLKSELGILTVYALTGVTLFQALYYAGLERSTAINASLLTPTLPIMVAVASRIVLGEQLQSIQILGVISAMAGAIWIAIAGDWASFSALHISYGDLLILAANFSMAIYTVMLRKVPSRLPPLAFMTAIALLGSAMLLPVWAWQLVSYEKVGELANHWVAMVYIGIVTYSVGYVLWNKSVEQNGATLTAVFLYLIPVFGTILAMIFLKERLVIYQLVGIGLIFAGIYLSLHSKSAPYLSSE